MDTRPERNGIEKTWGARIRNSSPGTCLEATELIVLCAVKEPDTAPDPAIRAHWRHVLSCARCRDSLLALRRAEQERTPWRRFLLSLSRQQNGTSSPVLPAPNLANRDAGSAEARFGQPSDSSVPNPLPAPSPSRFAPPAPVSQPIPPRPVSMPAYSMSAAPSPSGRPSRRNPWGRGLLAVSGAAAVLLLGVFAARTFVLGTASRTVPPTQALPTPTPQMPAPPGEGTHSAPPPLSSGVPSPIPSENTTSEPGAAPLVNTLKPLALSVLNAADGAVVLHWSPDQRADRYECRIEADTSDSPVSVSRELLTETFYSNTEWRISAGRLRRRVAYVARLEAYRGSTRLMSETKKFTIPDR